MQRIPAHCSSLKLWSLWTNRTVLYCSVDKWQAHRLRIHANFDCRYICQSILLPLLSALRVLEMHLICLTALAIDSFNYRLHMIFRQKAHRSESRMHVQLQLHDHNFTSLRCVKLKWIRTDSAYFLMIIAETSSVRKRYFYSLCRCNYIYDLQSECLVVIN